METLSQNTYTCGTQRTMLLSLMVMGIWLVVLIMSSTSGRHRKSGRYIVVHILHHLSKLTYYLEIHLSQSYCCEQNKHHQRASGGHRDWCSGLCSTWLFLSSFCSRLSERGTVSFINQHEVIMRLIGGFFLVK